MSRDRTESGQYAETVTIDRVRRVFRAVDGPAVTTADIAAELGVTAEAARRKLNELHTRGMLGKRKTAGRNLYWLQAESDAADLNPDDPVWGTEPIPGDETVSEADIDDVLYGELNE
ncbi:MAG: hypothetical protein J07HN6_02210 [Halonotius sp. J07HN6]|jgi:hypothetical protein|nr:MAG: hypothetical protein J07HN6_02210 [Halonotius sp. J07HN6]ESS08284.1 MAG: hypothetical protein A07HN63_02306 [uncultured archaeon A07HN63]